MRKLSLKGCKIKPILRMRDDDAKLDIEIVEFSGIHAYVMGAVRFSIEAKDGSGLSYTISREDAHTLLHNLSDELRGKY